MKCKRQLTLFKRSPQSHRPTVPHKSHRNRGTEGTRSVGRKERNTKMVVKVRFYETNIDELLALIRHDVL